MNNDNLILTQTLHGYSDGHTLLASSVDLPPEARRIMLNLSDMSGGNMERGFEEYLTGYPIKDAHLYAIAKTWYAPEMPRPGCVWTHTILVNFNDLPRLTNIEYLLSLFKRPIIGNFDYYHKEIVVDETDNLNEYRLPLGGIEDDLIKTILKNLYSTADSPIFITAPNSTNFDRLFLMLWRQQWPRLRRNFSFCTGSVAPRMLNGTPLDLQVIPYDIESQKGKINKAISIQVSRQNQYIEEKWVELAYEDLLFPSPALKRFLNYFGSDVDIKRTSFQTLLELFVFFKNEKPLLTDTIKFLSERLPSAKEGVNLKSTVFGNESKSFSFIPQYEEPSIVFQLATTEFFKSFNYSKLNFNNRFFSFFSSFNDTSIEVLKKMILNSPNQFGEDAITALANNVQGTEMHAIWKDRQLSTVFIGLNPRLTFNSDFWLANVNNQQEIIHQLQRTDLEEAGWQKIAGILIDTGSKIEPKLLSNQFSGLEKIILDKINDESANEIGNNWLKFIKNDPKIVLDWMNESENFSIRTINILVQILDPNSEVVVRNGLLPWLHFLNSLSSADLTKLNIEIHVFCLSLAFNLNSDEAQDVFALTFEKVYFALASDSVSYSLWRSIEIHTKPLSWLKDWDKCKKLINALVDHYIKSGFSIKRIASKIHNENLRERILSQYKKRK